MLLEELDDMAKMLARMSPQQRQQFAAMHHNDPYMLSLTKFVNDTVRENAQAFQNQQLLAQPAQPPVNQQVVAGMAPPQPQPMLPEDQGIAALPTQDAMVQGAAVGGIVGGDEDYDMAVGYADGGMVERYQDRGLVGPYAQTAGDVLQQIPGYVPSSRPLLVGQEGAPQERPPLLRFIDYTLELGNRKRVERARKRVEMGVASEDDIKLLKNAAATAAAAAQAPSSESRAAVPPVEGELDPTTGRALRAAAAAPAAAPTPAPAPAPAAEPEGRRSMPAQAEAMPPAKTAEQLSDIYSRAMGAVTATDPAAAERQKLQEDLVAAAKAREAEFEKDVAARGDRFKAREERLTAREGRLKEEAKTNEGLALLSAAAAVLTPGGLAAGLGKAAQVAIPQYEAGLAKLRAAQERIEEGRDRIDELRQNYDDLTAKERRQLRDGVNTAGIEARKLGIEGIMATQGVKEKQAKSIFDALMQQEQERIQQAGAMARTRVAGEYSVAAAKERGAGAGGYDFKLASLAETTRKNIAAEADKIPTLKYDPVARAKFIETELQKAIQQNPRLAEYMGVTGGGGVTVPQGVTVRKVGD